jgi:nicotinate phosphoribosyltransferase
VPRAASHKDLLVPIFRSGKLVYEQPSIHDTRIRVENELGRFYAGVKRLLNPHLYSVGLDEQLHSLKANLIREARRQTVEIVE